MSKVQATKIKKLKSPQLRLHLVVVVIHHLLPQPETSVAHDACEEVASKTVRNELVARLPVLGLLDMVSNIVKIGRVLDAPCNQSQLAF